jgi:indolepyruvate ferredoxin oxidoreductase beta subunit
MEPMESLRYLPYLKKDGWIITDSKPYLNINNYPEEKKMFGKIMSYPNHLIIDASKIAKKVGNSRAVNLVLLGAAMSHIPLKERAIIAAIKTLFEPKGKRIVDLNLKAFEAGKEYVNKKGKK